MASFGDNNLNKDQEFATPVDSALPLPAFVPHVKKKSTKRQMLQKGELDLGHLLIEHVGIPRNTRDASDISIGKLPPRCGPGI
jgi:hypothetical protein